MRLATECLLLLTMAQMWNLLAGYAGLVSLGHQVFVAFGAYSLFMTAGWLELTPMLGAAGGAAGQRDRGRHHRLPLFRLREAYFSIAMWVFAEIIGALTMKSSVAGRHRRAAARDLQADRFRLVRADHVLAAPGR